MYLEPVVHALVVHPRLVRTMVWCLATDSLSTIRLFVISGVRLVGEGVSRAIQARRRANIAVVGYACLTETANLADQQPDVILVDVANFDAVAAAKTLHALSPTSKLIGFAVADEEVRIACSMAGYAACVNRDAGIDELLRAVSNVHDGWTAWSPPVVSPMFDRRATLRNVVHPTNSHSPLTAREQQVLTLSSEGCSNKEIARQLKISPATVKNHMHAILQKLRVETRGRAAALGRTDRQE